jgi:hypothetical protein
MTRRVAPLAAMLVARYVDLGGIGPFPDVMTSCGSRKVFAAIGAGLAGSPLLPVLRCIGGITGKPGPATSPLKEG